MARLLVLGSSNTDMTVRLPRLPAPGQTVVGGSLLNGPGGKGANQAVAAGRAGAEVVFVSAIGDDTLGRDALACYRREGIDVSHIKTLPGVSSGVALIFVGASGENMIGVAPGANAWLGPDDVERLPAGLFCPEGLLLVAGLEIPIETAARAVRRASEVRMRVVLNPAPAFESLTAAGFLHAVDAITPNRVELGMLTGCDTSQPEGVVEAARALRAEGVRAVVVTLGSDGCMIVADTGVARIPSHAVDAVDTVGAGDAFTAALAVALAEGRSLAEAANWANAAGALAVTKPGAQASLPYRLEIDRLASAPARLSK
jgi:ribokinase